MGAVLTLLQACAQKQEVRIVQKKAAPSPPVKTEIIITAVGDVMMPVSIQSSVARNNGNYDILFEKIAEDLGAADITFANLETPVDEKAASSGYPKFNAPQGLLKALKKAGVDIISVANNHAMDAGSGGLKRTLDNIDATGLLFVGAGRTKAEATEIKYVKAQNVNVAFLAYTYGVNQRLPRKAAAAPGVNVLCSESKRDLADAVVAVRRAKESADLVVVSIHWGEEYTVVPSSWQRKAASALVEAGADIILGHHPHVLQSIESHVAGDGRVGLIVFSLGNFVSSQSAGITYGNRNNRKALRGDGIILSIAAVKEGEKVRLDRAEFLPIWTLRDQTGKATVYQPVSMAREMKKIDAVANRTKTQENIRKLLAYRMEVVQKALVPRE